MVACRRPPETIGPRPRATPQHQSLPPRSNPRSQWPPRIIAARAAVPLAVDLATAASLVPPDPNVASVPSSHPSLLRCCDDQLNSPSSGAVGVVAPSRLADAGFRATK